MTWNVPHELDPALRRFPDQADSIVRLAARDEAFRDMCEELAAAEAALSALAGNAAANAPERRAECEGWIVRLTEEISEALRRSDVVPLRPRKHE